MDSIWTSIKSIPMQKHIIQVEEVTTYLEMRVVRGYEIFLFHDHHSPSHNIKVRIFGLQDSDVTCKNKFMHPL